MTKVTKENNYRNEASPEGGWGYVVTVSVSMILNLVGTHLFEYGRMMSKWVVMIEILICVIGVGPLTTFGILFGDFLAQLGNKVEGAAVANSMFLAFMCFVGLFGNQLLKKYSCRFVGVIGACLVVLGSFCTIFVKNLTQLCLTYGFLQGMGVGLCAHAMYKTFNEYFIVKRNPMMFMAQSLYAAINMALPYITQILLNHFGFRGTLLIICGFNMNIIVAVLTLLPVKQKKKQECKQKFLLTYDEKIDYQTIEILEEYELKNKYNMHKNWQHIYDFFELSLLKDPVYVNIIFGLSFVCIADIMFMALLPGYLQDLKFNTDAVANVMTIFMIADFVGRVILALSSTCFTIKSRYLVLIGTITAIIGRTVFVLIDKEQYYEFMGCITIIGLFRCLLELTMPIVLVEYTHNRFNAALAHYEIIHALISFCIGPLSKLVISLTGENVWIIHMYNALLLLCTCFWIIEMLFIYFKSKCR